MKYWSIFSVTMKSEMTPSRSGLTATIEAGVRPTIRFASAPMARMRFETRSMATTDGSSMTMPRPRTLTSVLAVPRSIAMSCENIPMKEESGLITLNTTLRGEWGLGDCRHGE